MAGHASHPSASQPGRAGLRCDWRSTCSRGAQNSKFLHSPPVGDHNTSPGVVFTLCPAMCSKRQLSFSDSVCCTSEHGRPGNLHCASRRPNIYCMAATGMSSDSQDGRARAKSRFSQIRPLARAPVKHTRPRASSRKIQKVSNARDTLLVSK